MVGKPRRESVKVAMKTSPRISKRHQDDPGGPTSSASTSAEVVSTKSTPYQRMRELLGARAVEAEQGATVVDSVEGLREVLRRKEPTSKLLLRMKLLWISDHAYGQWKLIRMHFVDAQAPETLDDMLSVFKVSYEANRQDIDSLLLTATLWNLESDSELLPSPGTIVDINEYSNLQLYNDTQCQLTTRLSQLSWEQANAEVQLK
ncbi:hypothetical protein PR003_g31305 [Phytophthora rubi]|uniref:Uncharacterized protein n=3 Tax=Phytophthora rubi TaxID=129364 RepID=A0A6A3M1M9_9STRA|nr:hypothetical protein PR001_g12827 [Phytophthora rubi]KAE9268885.1 hypothetical protein PR003_g31305 [Phytophthora rubi]